MEDITGPTQHVTTQVPASKLRKGNFLLIKHRPCILTALSVTKTGKFGYKKAKLDLVDVVTLNKHDEIMRADKVVDVLDKKHVEVVYNASDRPLCRGRVTVSEEICQII